jgi:hypothetical protein
MLERSSFIAELSCKALRLFPAQNRTHHQGVSRLQCSTIQPRLNVYAAPWLGLYTAAAAAIPVLLLPLPLQLASSKPTEGAADMQTTLAAAAAIPA